MVAALKRPCKSCPFWPGNERVGWEPNAKRSLQGMESAGLGEKGAIMECHSASQAVCAGWGAGLGRNSLTLRFLQITGRAPRFKCIKGQAMTLEELDARAAGAPNWE